MNNLIYVIAVTLAITSVVLGMRAAKLNYDLLISAQNHAAALDSVRTTYEDSLTGVTERARLARIESEDDLQKAVEALTSEKRDLQSRIVSLLRTNATLTARIDSIPTTVTRVERIVDSAANTDVLQFSWNYDESHGDSRMNLEGQTTYTPPDHAVTSINNLTFDLALTSGIRKRDDGMIEHFVISDWPGLVITMEGAVTEGPFYPKKSKWTYVTHGAAAVAGLILGRL